MLVFLAEYLAQYQSGFGVFSYLTFRGILGAGTALAISLAELFTTRFEEAASTAAATVYVAQLVAV